MAKRKSAKKPSIASAPLTQILTDEEIRWVAENLHSSPAENEAPSGSAWGMHRTYTLNDDMRAKFWPQMYSKVAGKEKPDERPSMTDDQRVFFRLFSTLEREKPELLNARFPRTASVSPIDTLAGSGVTQTPGIKNSAVATVESAGFIGVPDSACA